MRKVLRSCAESGDLGEGGRLGEVYNVTLVERNVSQGVGAGGNFPTVLKPKDPGCTVMDESETHLCSSQHLVVGGRGHTDWEQRVTVGVKCQSDQYYSSTEKDHLPLPSTSTGNIN